MVIWIVDCTYHIIIPTIEVQILDIKKPETFKYQTTYCLVSKIWILNGGPVFEH